MALLAASVLFAGTLQGQRGGGMFRGGAGYSHFHHSRNVGSTLVPLWDDEPVEPEAPPAPVFVVTRANTQPAAPIRQAASAKIIEVPGAANSAAFRPLPPATFILTNGERLEARRYLLTYDHLRFTVDRQQRSIPLAMVDVDATIAANRKRGINLRIPADRSEISVGF